MNKQTMCKLIYFIFSLLLFSQAMLPQTSATVEPTAIPKLQAHAKIDGKLDEPCWQEARRLDLPVETEPAENIPALVQTYIYVFYNKTHVFFALDCRDPHPENIRARYSDRDHFGTDDVININLDTFNDERKNYFFGVNPLGVQRDGIETSSGNGSWDGLWDSAGRITDTGYIIELAIPFSTLQFQQVKGPQIWGLDISRWYPRDYRRRMGLVKMDRNNNSYQSQFLKIIGFENVKPGKNIEIVPTVTGIKTDERDSLPAGELHKEPLSFDPGLTARWGITNNLVLSGTVNPDFSQVEADSRQLDINQPFALYFEEKRPFFNEGADFFNSPLNVIYTRTLRNPQWGLKLSGKEAGNTIGAYLVRDDMTNLIFPGSQDSAQTSLNLPSTALVLRYKRDFGNRYTLGALVTNREGGDYFNRVFGLDGEARLSQRNRFQFQFLGSSTRYSDEIATAFNQPQSTFSDKALTLIYKYSSRNVNLEGLYQDVGKEFRADQGYMPQVDYRVFSGETSYRWIKSNSWWSLLTLGAEFQYAKDHDNHFLNEEQELYINLNGLLQSYLNFSGKRTREAYHGSIYELFTGSFGINFAPLADVAAYVGGNFGDRIDYANSRQGRRFQINGNMTYNIGQHVKLTLDHNYEKMSVHDSSLYTAHISQGSLIYHLNAHLFFQGILQYVNYHYNVANYTFPIDPKYKNLFAQLLLSYRLNPRTVAFLGYTDNYQGTHEYKLTRKSRTLFLKVSYSWQF